MADVLFGDVNPAGRLPVTFYRSTRDLPAFDDYSMTNRTYRYFNGQPLFAFGHGLSYTQIRLQRRPSSNATEVHRRRHGEADVQSEKHRRARRR